jgi:FAD/FMN-containing dehydrogenase
VEFDNNDRSLKKVVKRASRVLENYASAVVIETESEEQQLLWKVRESTSMLLAHNEGMQHPTPLTDAAVPLDRIREFIEALYAMLKDIGIQPALWGHIGEADITLQPMLNMTQVGDRQKAFRFFSEYHKLVISYGGTISASSGDGRLRTPFLEQMYGTELYALLQKLKQIFDPYATLNPGVKFGTSLDDVKGALRVDYSLEHVFDHLPRS